jgi:hypothetical protein
MVSGFGTLRPHFADDMVPLGRPQSNKPSAAAIYLGILHSSWIGDFMEGHASRCRSPGLDQWRPVHVSHLVVPAAVGERVGTHSSLTRGTRENSAENRIFLFPVFLVFLVSVTTCDPMPKSSHEYDELPPIAAPRDGHHATIPRPSMSAACSRLAVPHSLAYPLTHSPSVFRP